MKCSQTKYVINKINKSLYVFFCFCDYESKPCKKKSNSYTEKNPLNSEHFGVPEFSALVTALF